MKKNVVIIILFLFLAGCSFKVDNQDTLDLNSLNKDEIFKEDEINQAMAAEIQTKKQINNLINNLKE